MDKIEYEEWALKAIDTTLAPKPWKRTIAPSTSTSTAPAPKAMHEPVRLSSLRVKSRSLATHKSAVGRCKQVELIFPESLLKSEELIESLKGQLQHREPHHRKAMWKCLM